MSEPDDENTASTKPESRYASAVGRSGAPVEIAVELGHVRRFAEATLDDAPRLAHDRARVAAPPTFAIALRAPDPRIGIDVDFTKLLHGEQAILLDRPIYVGDVLTVQATIVDAYTKPGKAGTMDFMVIETVGRAEDGERVFRSRSVTVIRR